MQTKVQKWGNSLGLRIPRTIAKDARVEAGSLVDISLAPDGLLVRPARGRRYSLSLLLKRINERNLHRELISGPAIGREAW